MVDVAAGLSWIAFPLYAVLGLHVRGRTPRLPPAAGSPLGQAGEAGKPPARLLVIGDSSAASVGIARQSDGMASRLAETLAPRLGAPVEWRAAGFNSATAGSLRDHVVHNLEPVAYSHILITVGFNDMKNFHSGRRWAKEFGGLIYALKARFPEARLYWSQMLDPAEMPALPPVLAAILRQRMRLFNRLGACLCGERGAVAIPPAVGLPPVGFCPDGIHPSEAGYLGWAEHVAPYMAAEAAEAPQA